MLVVPEKIATRCDVEKAFHEDMPKSIKAILLDYKDIFPTDLPPGLPPRGGQTFPKSTEFRNSVAFCPFFGCPFPCFSVRVAESVS